MIHSSKNIVNIKSLQVIKQEIVKPEDEQKPIKKKIVKRKLMTTENISFVKSSIKKVRTVKNNIGIKSGQSKHKKNS